MSELLRMLQNRISCLESGLRQAQKDYSHYPKGKLRISSAHGYARFFLVNDARDSTGKYISRKDVPLISSLARKEYNIKFLAAAKKEIQGLKRTAALLEAKPVESSYEKLHIGIKNYAKPYIMTDQQYAEMWQKKMPESNGFRVEGLVYETNRGDLVRSKSEALLANLLLKLGIPYHYEKPLELKGGIVRYPDFTLLHVARREEIYLEHFGLLDDKEYREKAMQKLEEYMDNGIFQGKNLLITYEAQNHPLKLGAISQMLTEIFC